MVYMSQIRMPESNVINIYRHKRGIRYEKICSHIVRFVVIDRMCR